MQVANKFMMLAVNVGDMAKSKEFYADKLGFEVTTDYRQDNDNWWVSLALPDGGATMTLSRSSESPDSVKSGTLALYFETFDVDAAHQELSGKELELSEVQDNLFGPGSGVKFFTLTDPDGNMVHVVQAHDGKVPF